MKCENVLDEVSTHKYMKFWKLVVSSHSGSSFTAIKGKSEYTSCALPVLLYTKYDLNGRLIFFEGLNFMTLH
jgi:hypothetical protein